MALGNIYSSKITGIPASSKTFICQSTVVRIYSGVGCGPSRRWNVVLTFSKETFIDENTLVLPVIDGLSPVRRAAGEPYLRYLRYLPWRRKTDFIVPAVSHPARCCPCCSTWPVRYPKSTLASKTAWLIPYLTYIWWDNVLFFPLVYLQFLLYCVNRRKRCGIMFRRMAFCIYTIECWRSTGLF